MPTFQHDGATIYFEEHGQGFPLLLLAPGGMRSSISFWHRSAYNPIKELSSQFRVIACDQRNAGQSDGPITADDGWHSYVGDQLALLDHLGVTHCHVLGGCIGGAFALGLIEAAPERVAAAVLQQPIGLTASNREVFYELFDSWAREITPRHLDVSSEAWQAFRERMYGGEFVFCVGRDAVRAARSPLLVLMGNDVYHPSEISREIVELAADAELIERWKDPDAVAATVTRVRDFLLAHTPA